MYIYTYIYCGIIKDTIKQIHVTLWNRRNPMTLYGGSMSIIPGQCSKGIHFNTFELFNNFTNYSGYITLRMSLIYFS